MNMKRWALASGAAFAVIFVVDMIAHGKCLMPLYQQTASVWRDQGHEMMWLMTLGRLLFSAVFAWIYTKGYEPKKAGLGQGVRYGFLVGVLISISYVSVWYVVLPIPLALALGWVAASVAACLGAGAAVGVLYRRD